MTDLLPELRQRISCDRAWVRTALFCCLHIDFEFVVVVFGSREWLCINGWLFLNPPDGCVCRNGFHLVPLSWSILSNCRRWNCQRIGASGIPPPALNLNGRSRLVEWLCSCCLIG